MTYIPTTNHQLLQKYIDATAESSSIKTLLLDIQSRLIEPMEYEIGKEYEFYNYIDGWIK